MKYDVVEWYYDWDIDDLVPCTIISGVCAKDAIDIAKGIAKKQHGKMHEYTEIKKSVDN